ncbi:MAG TPA: RNA pseudouridine synthase [Pseudogracilibacillus sp.]|nr:RNA pseudouridine synthase [Pseudogracilibacillus sp.]
MDIPILYEDNHLLIVEKPVNVPVQGDESGDLDLLNMLKQDLKIRYQKPGNVYLGLVHRLDRPVGGAIVFAKTSKAASRLSNELRKQAIEREYLAVVRGKMKQPSGKLENYLVKDRQKNIVHVTKSSVKESKKAVLYYKVETAAEGLSRVRVQLETGRPHQIRVQLNQAGNPIYGDQKYGQKVNRPGEQIALWAERLSVKHPTKDEIITVYSEPPEQYPWNF